MPFDLDGTRIDSVYQHIFAWQQALTGRLVGPITQSGA